MPNAARPPAFLTKSLQAGNKPRPTERATLEGEVTAGCRLDAMEDDEIRAMLGDETAMRTLAAYRDLLAAPDSMQLRRLDKLYFEVVFGRVEAYLPGRLDSDVIKE